MCSGGGYFARVKELKCLKYCTGSFKGVICLHLFAGITTESYCIFQGESNKDQGPVVVRQPYKYEQNILDNTVMKSGAVSHAAIVEMESGKCLHDDVIKWKYFPRYWPFVCGEFTGPRWIPRTKASDAELWCFLWSAPE